MMGQDTSRKAMFEALAGGLCSSIGIKFRARRMICNGKDKTVFNGVDIP